MRLERFSGNPLVTPEMITASRDDFEVVCAFNAGATRYKGETLLLLRVAERPRDSSPNEYVAPILELETEPPEITLLRVRRDSPDTAQEDARMFTYRGEVYLTSISHLRLARSRDGRRFAPDATPALVAATWSETFGVEDPRITLMDGTYYITYTAVSPRGIASALASTDDFRSFKRHDIIFPPENRDVTIFPEKVGGRYVCHHRPVGHSIGGFDMWAAFSDDLVHWGGHKFVMRRRPGLWDSARVGGGTVPMRTERGWLSIYHGADENDRYALGALLCDPDHPERVIARSAHPLLEPETDYELQGFFGNVVFTCGAVLEGDVLTVYYGAADRLLCGAAGTLPEILTSLSAP